MPVSGESVTPFQPNSGVVVLPRITAPWARSRAVLGASSSTRSGPDRPGSSRARWAWPLVKDQVLDRDRHTVEQAARAHCVATGSSAARACARAPASVDQAIGVEAPGCAAQWRQAPPSVASTGDKFAAAIERDQFARRQIGQIVGHASFPQAGHLLPAFQLTFHKRLFLHGCRLADQCRA